MVAVVVAGGLGDIVGVAGGVADACVTGGDIGGGPSGSPTSTRILGGTLCLPM